MPFRRIICFVSTILTVYFLPKLAVAKNNQETKPFFEFYKGILPFFILGVTIVYFTRFFIVKLLFAGIFTSDHFVLWQLVGDVLKVASLILGYQFLQKITVALLLLNYYLFLSFTSQYIF
jgi:PST family polysaccharide transporter